MAFVVEGQGNGAGVALAGTGKTWIAVRSVVNYAERYPNHRVACAAFNGHIAAELNHRLPPSVPSFTLHSLGFTAVRKAFPGVEVDEAKLRTLAQQLAPNEWPSVRKSAEHLARLCKYTLTPERDATGLAELVDHYGIELDDRDQLKVFKLAGDLVEQSAAQTRVIDYDDQVWFPIRYRLPVDRYDVLLGDEAQDWNRVQQALARKATEGGRLVPIGDENQAIYGFAGADCDALPRLTKELAATVLPLTVTWRCPRLHVELARSIVPDLEAAPNAIEGEVWEMSRKEIAEAARPGCLVICRKNAPIVSMTYRLVLAGVPAVMRGREIGRGLINLIARLKPDTLQDLIDKVEDHREKEHRRLDRKKAAQSQYEALNDRCDCLGQLAAQVTSLEQLEAFIEEKFDDAARPGEQVVLSSVHRAKGLEADTVFVLDPKSLPLIRRDSKPWQRTQESNLCYIAATRSKRVLVFEDHVPSIFRS